MDDAQIHRGGIYHTVIYHRTLTYKVCDYVTWPALVFVKETSLSTPNCQ